MQEESRSISENVTWGQRKRFADGKVSLPYKNFLGYEKGEDGQPQIVEAQAKIVKMIYKMFHEGNTPSGIAKQLTAQKIPTPSGKQIWQYSTVLSILTNEKYKGDAVLQKSFTVDFLTKKKKVNEGEVPQYYVENSHSAIISPEFFDMVQMEIKKRKAVGYTSAASCFSNKIICGDCGGFYGSKVWHSTSKYRRTIYQCNSKFKGNKKCKTPHLDEDHIKRIFTTVVNELISEKDEIIFNFELIGDTIFNTASLDAKYAKLQSEMAVSAEIIQRYVDENGRIAQSQEEYRRRYDELVTHFEMTKHSLEEVVNLRTETKARRNLAETFIASLRQQDMLIAEFDEQLWYNLLDYVTVYSNDKILFTFKNGQALSFNREHTK